MFGSDKIMFYSKHTYHNFLFVYVFFQKIKDLNLGGNLNYGPIWLENKKQVAERCKQDKGNEVSSHHWANMMGPLVAHKWALFTVCRASFLQFFFTQLSGEVKSLALQLQQK